MQVNRIENITFRNVSYNGRNANPNRIYGYDAERAVEGVQFINLRINGQLILSPEQGNIELNEHAKGVSFASNDIVFAMIILVS